MRVFALIVLTAISVNSHAALIWDFSWDTDVSSGSGTLYLPSDSGNNQETGSSTARFDASFNFNSWQLSCKSCDFVELTWELNDNWEFTKLGFEFREEVELNCDGDEGRCSDLSVNIDYTDQNGLLVTCNMFVGVGCNPGEFNVSQRVSSTLELTPRHASVPEPSTVLLFIGGLAALRLRRIDR